MQDLGFFKRNLLITIRIPVIPNVFPINQSLALNQHAQIAASAAEGLP
jgi:hypothetical protein